MCTPSVDAALGDVASLEAYAERATALSRLDPRAKILALMGFLAVVVSFDRYAVTALLPLALFPLGVAAVGNIPLSVILRRVLIASPFALMVGIFNPWFDPASVTLAGGLHISAGWLSFASILLRFVLTVSATLLLIASTGVVPLCQGLYALGMPQALIQQLLLLQRYTQVLVGEATRMQLARTLRGGGRGGLPLAQWASLLGHLLLRALQRAQRIHQAMLSRGYDGTLPVAKCYRWSSYDTFYVLGCSAFFILIRFVDVPQVLGAALLRLVA